MRVVVLASSLSSLAAESLAVGKGCSQAAQRWMPARSRLKIRGKGVPRAEGCHLALKGRLAIEPFEDGDVGVGRIGVGVECEGRPGRSGPRYSRDRRS